MASLLDVAASAGAERRSPLDRKDEFESISDVYAYKANGNRLPTLRGRKLIEEKANKVIAEARVNMSQRENHEIRKQGINGRPLLPARKE
jgi:ribosome-associated toxin RatA of RatAB toxin-antitoxin module